MQMVRIIDGSDQPTVTEITLPEDKLEHVMVRLLRCYSRLKKLSDIPRLHCLVCSAIARERVTHAGGCSSTYNICFKCLGQHRSQNCFQKWSRSHQDFVSSAGCLFSIFVAYHFIQRRKKTWSAAQAKQEIF